MDPAAVEKAISRAGRTGDLDELERLFDAAPYLIEAKDPQQGYNTPIILAARNGYVRTVRMLLERGADCNAKGLDGKTALHAAVERGNEELIAILLSRGADSNGQCNAGNTALIAASISNRVHVVRQLLQHMQGRGLNKKDVIGATALWWACHRGYVEVVMALLLAGADHTLVDYNGRTPRQIALDQKRVECVNCLEWWEGELERAYALLRARRVDEDRTSRQHAPGGAVPAYLRQRVERGEPLPRVQLRSGMAGRRYMEEDYGPPDTEKRIIIDYAMHDLAPELFIELLAGFPEIRAGDGTRRRRG